MGKQRYPALPLMLLQDLNRYKRVILLLLLVVFSALAVIYIAHQNRQLTADRDQLLSARDLLDREWRHLIIEQNSLTEHSRVERLAQQKLQMVDVDSEREELVPWQ
ncbi:cell division protein FtsL [Idiomarina seosinensis]|uniref:cell division protein FtsL n=1 Tax=Idiomarina seosinensis TaxID=281739 RepID=UPI00384D08CA